MTDHCSCPGCEPGDDCPLNELEKERDAAIARAEKAENDIKRWKAVTVCLFKKRHSFTDPYDIFSVDTFMSMLQNGDLEAVEDALDIMLMRKTD